MRRTVQASLGTAFIIMVLFLGAERQEATQKAEVSFKKDVAPVIQRACLPCHAEESMNPSGLSLDTYDNLMSGGKHGSPVVPGKPDESIIIKKLSPNPPFGDRMPLHRRKDADDSKRKVTDEDIQLIKDWIAQGAKDN